jgi:hypothetical protein
VLGAAMDHSSLHSHVARNKISLSRLYDSKYFKDSQRSSDGKQWWNVQKIFSLFLLSRREQMHPSSKHPSEADLIERKHTANGKCLTRR